MSTQHVGQKRRRRSTSSDIQDDRTARIRADFNHFSGGAQHNNSATGTQNNNSGLGTQYNATNINIVDKQKNNFLADLRVTDPRDDKARIERTKGSLLKDSYRWILEHKDFRQWRADKRLLWIKGEPGKGKTMLLCGVIDELAAMGYKSTFFFCQAADARLNTATSVLRGLLFLILDQNPILLDSIRNDYDRVGTGKQLFEDINSWEVLCRMLWSAVSHHSMQDVVVVIDALDECCTEDLDQLISIIVEMTAHVKVIASSRPELRIGRALIGALEDANIYSSLELSEEVISAAVHNYIYHKVEKLATLKGLEEEVKINVRNHLASKANHTFLWVALVYDQLADSRIAKRHIKRKLGEFPPGLESLYNKILAQILETLDAEDCKQVLAVMSIVSRPLDLTELASLLDQIEDLEEIVEACGSLLTVREGTVYFVHQSAKDFLVRQADRITPSGIARTHSLVLSTLLQSMSSTLRRNIYEINDPGTPIKDLSVPSPNPLWPLRYACVYWADHLTDDHIGEHHFDEVYVFIIRHFLHWVEALGLLGSISKGILSMSRVKRIIEASTEPTEWKLVVRDAVRFMQYFRVPIEVDPMQVYYSALVFSPTNSIIRGLFREEEPKWTSKPIADEDWSLCMQTLEGGEVELVEFSPDKSVLAASHGCRVSLWNTVTGHCEVTLETYVDDTCVKSLAFSPIGTTLASASSLRINIWNTVDGQRICSLDTKWTEGIAFSRDGALLASVSRAGRIQLWQTKHFERTLQGPNSRASSMTFSTTSPLLASERFDGAIELWETAAWKCLKTTSGYGSFQILPYDGSNLVSRADFESRVTVYNLQTGSYFNLSDEHLSVKVTSTITSRDGANIAIGDASGNTHLWDITTNRRTGILSGHNGAVISVAFSMDGTLLASASQDGSIKLWDLTTEQPDSLTSLQEIGPAVPYSQGSVLCRSHDDVITVIRDTFPLVEAGQDDYEDIYWITEPGVVPNTVCNRHLEAIHTLSFECDGSRVIALSNHYLSVWDTQTGHCLQTITGNAVRPPCAVTFHNGNIYMAAAFDNRIDIMVRTVSGDIPLRTLEICKNGGQLMVLSSPGFTRDLRPTDQLFHYPSHIDVTSVQFSRSGYQLDTNFGTIDLYMAETSRLTHLRPTIPRNPRTNPGEYDLKKWDSWVTKQGRKFLWLPTEYRSDVIQICGSTIAIGYRSGRVLIARFS